MTKRFKLLRDVPGAKAGTIFEKQFKNYRTDGEGGFYEYYRPDASWPEFGVEMVENNPTWFALIEEENQENEEYNRFIRSGLAIGFTDDQVDWLWDNISKETYSSCGQDVKK